MCHECHGDVCRNELIVAAEDWVFAELWLNARKGWVCTQALGDLLAVSDREKSQVAVAVLEHQVVGFSDLFVGSREREDSVCEFWFGEGGNYAIGGFFDGCPKLGGMGGELVEFGTPGGLEGGHGYVVGCLLVVDNSDGFKWVCYP